jgi:hypothetical protein
MDLPMNKPSFGAPFRWASLLCFGVMLLSKPIVAFQSTYGITLMTGSSAEYTLSGSYSFRSTKFERADDAGGDEPWTFVEGDATGEYGPLTCETWGCYNHSAEIIHVAVNAMIRGKKNAGDDDWCSPSLFTTDKNGTLGTEIGVTGIIKNSDAAAYLSTVVKMKTDTGVAIGTNAKSGSYDKCEKNAALHFGSRSYTTF